MSDTVPQLSYSASNSYLVSYEAHEAQIFSKHAIGHEKDTVMLKMLLLTLRELFAARKCVQRKLNRAPIVTLRDGTSG